VALDCNGTSGYLRYDYGPVDDDVPVTMAAWARTYIVSGVQTALLTYNFSSRHRHYLIYTAAGLKAASADSFSTTSADGLTVGVDEWHHWAGVWRASNHRIAYLDGVAGTAGTANKLYSAPDTAQVGASIANSNGSPGTYLNGQIELPAIWGAALTDEEIRALASGALPWTIRPEALRLCPDLEDSRRAYYCRARRAHPTVVSAGVSWVPGRHALMRPGPRRLFVAV
jgi:hypothetical protein